MFLNSSWPVLLKTDPIGVTNRICLQEQICLVYLLYEFIFISDMKEWTRIRPCDCRTVSSTLSQYIYWALYRGWYSLANKNKIHSGILWILSLWRYNKEEETMGESTKTHELLQYLKTTRLSRPVFPNKIEDDSLEYSNPYSIRVPYSDLSIATPSSLALNIEAKNLKIKLFIPRRDASMAEDQKSWTCNPYTSWPSWWEHM